MYVKKSAATATTSATTATATAATTAAAAATGGGEAAAAADGSSSQAAASNALESVSAGTDCKLSDVLEAEEAYQSRFDAADSSTELAAAAATTAAAAASADVVEIDLEGIPPELSKRFREEEQAVFQAEQDKKVSTALH
jgi:hypothetical protein